MYVFARVIDRSLVSVFQHVCEAVHVYLVCILRFLLLQWLFLDLPNNKLS